MLFIPGHNLSSECGDQYFRCQELLVVNESLFVQNMDHTGGMSLNNNIIFVPLKDGALFLHLWYDSSNNMIINWSSFIVNSSNCTPTVSYNINSTIYMVCINSYTEYVAVYEVQLNLSDSVVEIEDVILVEQLTRSSFSISGSNSSSNFSNFITVDHKIFVAVGNTIIVMDIDTKQLTQYDPAAAALPNCTQIYKLVPAIGAGNQQLLLAYCIDRYVYIDPQYGDWTDGQCYSSNGIPYLCPDNNYRAISFINGTLKFSERDITLSVNTRINISSGICFESQNTTYFAYSDQQHNNVYVYNFITKKYFSVFPYDCTHQDCPQLHFLENQYLVIRDANHNLVLDATTNFSLIINISSGIADILTILHSNVYVYSAITPSPQIPLTTSTAKAPFSRKISATTSMSINTPNYIHTITLSPSESVTMHSSVTVTTISPGINFKMMYTGQTLLFLYNYKGGSWSSLASETTYDYYYNNFISHAYYLTHRCPCSK